MKKILQYSAIVSVLFVLLVVWMIFVQPKIDHNRNLKDLEGYMKFFRSIKHPEATHEIYCKSFFGNSTGTSNHCEHIIVQIRKYNPEKEREIDEYYKKNYSGVNVSFVKTLDDCCGDYEYGYKAICLGYFVEDQPKLTYETEKNFLPVYLVEYTIDGSHLSDWECN